MWIIYALTAAILWGLNYSLSERILASISAYSLLALEMIFGGIFFAFLSYLGPWKKDLQILASDSQVLKYTLIEILVLTIASFCIVVSIREKNATAAGIVELLYPLFTIGFSWFLFRENHVDTSVIIGGILIFIGVVLIAR